MLGAVTTRDLDGLLAAVSRSIFLTLKVAPRRVRRQLGCSYLFCRAADTIADTRLLPPSERREHLETFRAQFQREEPRREDLAGIARRVGGSSPLREERELLERLEECFDLYRRFSSQDRLLVRRLVTTLTAGMEMDLERFPPEESGEIAALDSDSDLDRYCYHVAGCVGEFWTELAMAHLRALRHWDPEAMRNKGVRFGKGLQMTNVLRDVDGDLAIGRVYLPGSRLRALGLTPEAFRALGERTAVRPVVHDLLRQTLEHYSVGWQYTLSIPRRLVSLRLACAWPLLIGLPTLELLARAADPCAPRAVAKITRRQLRRILFSSAVRVCSNRALDRLYRRLRRRAEAPLASSEASVAAG